MNYVSERRPRAASIGQPMRPLPRASAVFVQRRLFSAGLALGSCAQLMDEAGTRQLKSMIDALDAIGADVRRNSMIGESEHEPEQQDDTVAPLVAEISRAVARLTDHMDSLCRGDVDRMSSIHVVGAVQSLQQALTYLDAAPCGPE